MEDTTCLKTHIKDDTNEHKAITDLVTDQGKLLSEIHSAIFGDSNGNKGMKATNDEMYKVFTASGLATRTTVKFFGAIGIISGAIVGVYEVIKIIFKK